MDHERARQVLEKVLLLSLRQQQIEELVAAFAEAARGVRDECLSAVKIDNAGAKECLPHMDRQFRMGHAQGRDDAIAAIRALSGDAPTRQEPPSQPESKTTMTPDLTEFRRKITDKMSTLSLSLRDVEAIAGVDAATLCRFLSGKECSVTNFMKLGRWLAEGPPPNPALALASALPWHHPELKGWSIVGMNHYHINGVRFLFVAMTHGKLCIKIESVDDAKTWEDLRRAALAMAGDGG